MTEDDWTVLLDTIKDGKCTPFLGAGVNHGILPLGGQIAREWAGEYGFPLRSSDDLPAVAQFIAVKYRDPMYPKDRILARLKRESKVDFSQPDPRLDCLRTLAELPLPVYLTTNYDDLLLQALRYAGRNPRREVCRWHAGLKSVPVVLGTAARYMPDYRNPVVFHFHGSDEFRESLVLTEDDYLDFLVNISRSPKVVPPRIQEALTDASLLFIGYGFDDTSFRVIYRGLVEQISGSMRLLNITVQATPQDATDPAVAQRYLTSYFEGFRVRVFWGTAVEFVRELRDRWNEFNRENSGFNG